MAMTSVNNGVNVQALLDAREALKGAPEAAKFTWRASCKWQNGTYSKTNVETFFGLGQEQQHKTGSSFDADHPGRLQLLLGKSVLLEIPQETIANGRVADAERTQGFVVEPTTSHVRPGALAA